MTGSAEIGSVASEVHPVAGHVTSGKTAGDMEAVHIEKTISAGDMMGKDHTDFDRVDQEVAKYASEVKVVIDAATNSRLKKLIDRRVLVIMILTYFLQALDKGTLSFASIMGIQQDTHLVGQQVYVLCTKHLQ